MGREFHTFEDFRTELNSAIDLAIENRVIDGAKEAIQEAEETNVYSYIPRFVNRRREAGGIKDKKNMYAHSDFSSIHEKTIELEISASWQNLSPGIRYGGGPNPTLDLVETIENRPMYNAPPRPFMDEAEVRYGQGRFEIDLMAGLAEQGFDN